MTWLDALEWLLLIPFILALFIGCAYVAWDAARDTHKRYNEDAWMREIERNRNGHR